MKFNGRYISDFANLIPSRIFVYLSQSINIGFQILFIENNKEVYIFSKVEMYSLVNSRREVSHKDAKDLYLTIDESQEFRLMRVSFRFLNLIMISFKVDGIACVE